MTAPPAPEPDAKDWTWAIREPCPDCGFDPRKVEHAAVPALSRRYATVVAHAVLADGAASRPDRAVWSPLEYGCHVRDVHVLFAERLRAMLDEDEPTFANWDQDATAIEGDYGSQDATVVAVELIEAAGTVAGIYSTVTDETSHRPGVRSNGDRFTVETLGSYHLHDVVHHLHDVGAG